MNADIVKKKLEEYSNSSTAKNYERYFRNAVRFRGVKTPQIVAVFNMLKKELLQLSVKEQVKIALDLYDSEFAEDKRFAAELLSKVAKKLDESVLDKIYSLFDTKIYDWASCDTLCSKVVSSMIMVNPEVAEKVVKWKDSAKKWAKRAAAISFVKLGRTGKFNKEIISICSTIVKDKERFVQLGCGWVLRELSVSDLNLAKKFIISNYGCFSREGLRYAVEKMSLKTRKELLRKPL